MRFYKGLLIFNTPGSIVRRAARAKCNAFAGGYMCFTHFPCVGFDFDALRAQNNTNLQGFTKGLLIHNIPLSRIFWRAQNVTMLQGFTKVLLNSFVPVSIYRRAARAKEHDPQGFTAVLLISLVPIAVFVNYLENPEMDSGFS